MEFHPPWWCKYGALQTIASMYLPKISMSFTTVDHIINFRDGASTLVHESNPQRAENLFILVHGLTGSAESRCVRRLAQYFRLQSHGVVRVNLRGCGSSRHLSKEICHAGRSEDLAEIVRYFSKRYPETRIHCIGFSLGANLLLQMAARSEHLGKTPTSVMAISPPIDLKACVLHLGSKSNRWLDYYFVKTLTQLTEQHPWPYEMPNKKIKSLYEFDNLITAKIAGFRNADDYYRASSSIHDLDKLSCPALIICAEDDPCVNFNIFADICNKPLVSFIGPKQGGHGAFLGYSQDKNTPWLEKVIDLWLEKNQLLKRQ